MADETKPKKKWRRIAGIAGSALSLAILTYVAVMLITGRASEIFRISALFSKPAPVEMADEFRFDVGRRRVFADLENYLAAAGSLGIQVLDAAGNETLRDPVRMTTPAIDARDGRAVAFDIGGTAVRVFNADEIIASIEAGGAVVSASINRNGWFCVCTQEGGASRGAVMVYNDKGKNVYRVTMATGYVLLAKLSPDNRNIAILNLTDDGSRISFYNLNSEDIDRVFELPGSLILDIYRLTNDNVLAVTTKSLILIDKDGVSRELYGFSDKRLSCYAYGGGFIALHLTDQGVSNRGRLVTVSEEGKILGETGTDREIISMSSGDGYLTVLRSDGIAFYNTVLDGLPVYEKTVSVAGASEVLALGGGMALAAGDHLAIIARTVIVE